MNPIIKFTTLFGLLAVELAIELSRNTSTLLAIIFFLLSVVFVWRSFYAMRIQTEKSENWRHTVDTAANSALS